MRTYTVYRHITPNGKMYIGLTIHKDPNRRWQNGAGYRTQALFYRAIKKYGWDSIKHEILATGLTKEEAEAMEIELIAKHKTTDHRYGYNIENGGNCLGTHSEETKHKIGEAQRGEKNHNWGKPGARKGIKASPETIRKNSLSHMGQPAWNKGKKMTEEQKKNMKGRCFSEEHRAKISAKRKKSVMCIETGVIYDSCMSAGFAYNINRGCISNAATGKSPRAGGMHWQYV